MSPPETMSAIAGIPNRRQLATLAAGHAFGCGRRLPLNHQTKADMQNSNRTIGLGVLAFVALVVLYYLWNYLIAFLAVVGAVQVYHVCRNRLGR